jgi:hypothetical protein
MEDVEYSLLINEVRGVRGLSDDSTDSYMTISQSPPSWYDWWVYCCCCCLGPMQN